MFFLLSQFFTPKILCLFSVSNHTFYQTEGTFSVNEHCSLDNDQTKVKWKAARERERENATFSFSTCVFQLCMMQGSYPFLYNEVTNGKWVRKEKNRHLSIHILPLIKMNEKTFLENEKIFFQKNETSHWKGDTSFQIQFDLRIRPTNLLFVDGNKVANIANGH